MPGDWGEGVWSGMNDEERGPHLLVLLVEVREGAWDEASVTVSLHSSSDGKGLT